MDDSHCFFSSLVNLNEPSAEMCGANALPERVHVIELLTEGRWDYCLSSFWIDEFRLMVVHVLYPWERFFIRSLLIIRVFVMHISPTYVRLTSGDGRKGVRVLEV